MDKIVSRNPSALGDFNFDALTQCISTIHSALQSSAANAVNRFATIRNWLIGRYIVEYEQNGNDRAQYGARLLPNIVEKVRIRGINTTMLAHARNFYLMYPQVIEAITPILPMLSGKLINIPFSFDLLSSPSDAIFPTASGKFTESIEQQAFEATERICPTPSGKFTTPATTLISKLSFSHIVELLSIDDPLIRFFYEFECMRNAWSVKELHRQIVTNLHIRVGLSKKPELAMKKLAEITEQQNTRLQIKDPLTLEFLGLDAGEYVTENDLETGLISHLQEFMLELGKGFCFEARQKRMIIDDRYYFADLVFYNRLLHCNVILEIKNDEFKHEYLGQLNAYVSYYRENEMQPGDNPPVGILLCTRKGKRMVEYALAGMDNNLFVSTYMLCLPDKRQLESFLENAID
ncbi:MAG: PDDEXK nuclease domain-containing protein [Bacteroidales bacterium]|nr:PDDEXK nuclease domain-containing protein [Bacteroidales bacterium]